MLMCENNLLAALLALNINPFDNSLRLGRKRLNNVSGGLNLFELSINIVSNLLIEISSK